MKLLGNRVIVEPLPKSELASEESSIFLPQVHQEKNPLAYVRQLGQPRQDGDFRERHAAELLGEIKVGDLIRYNTLSGGHELDFQGRKCVIISTLDVQAIIREC